MVHGAHRIVLGGGSKKGWILPWKIADLRLAIGVIVNLVRVAYSRDIRPSWLLSRYVVVGRLVGRIHRVCVRCAHVTVGVSYTHGAVEALDSSVM